MKKVLLSYVVLVIAATAMYAVPYTTMGMLHSPDAYVLPNKAAEITFTNYFRREKSSFTKNYPYEYIPMGMLNMGFFNRVELGGWVGDGIGFANLKIRVIRETRAIPQIAVGIDNLLSPVKEDGHKIAANEKYGTNPDKFFYEKNSPYIVFSKASIVKRLPGIDILETVTSLGFGRNKFRGQVALSHKVEGIFGSISIRPMKDFTIITEMDGHNLNIGAQYFYKNFTFKVGYVGLEETENNRIGLAVSYLFDKYADAQERPLFPYETEQAGGKTTGQTLSTSQQGKPGTTGDLLDELKKLREQREAAQKVLESLKAQLKQMEEEAGTGQ